VQSGCGGPLTDAQLYPFFGQFRPRNNVLRFFAHQGLAINGITGLRDWSGIDAVVEAAQSTGTLLMMVLGNQAGECNSDNLPPSWYQSGYLSTNPGQTTSYYQYVSDAVTRYRDSPAVGFWTPQNEPYVGAGNIAILASWFTAICNLIKSIDPYRPTTMGGSTGDADPGDFLDILQNTPVDVGEYHDYNFDDTPISPEFAARIADAKTAGKPIITGECGINANDSVGGCKATAVRAAEFKAKMDGQFAAGVSGFLPWNLSYTNPACNTDIVTGDPTLALIHDYPVPST